MHRRAAALIAVAALAVGGAVGWLRVVPAMREREAARAFTALAICLAGAPRVSPEEAPIRARRLHATRSQPKNTFGGPCADEAYALANSPGIRAVAPALAREAEAASSALGNGRVPDNVAALWRAAEHLRWMPAPGSASEQAPTPLLDAQLPELRRALPRLADLHRNDLVGVIDDHPVDRALIAAYPDTLVVSAGAAGRPLAVATWTAEPPPRRPWVTVNEGRVLLQDGPEHRLYIDAGQASVVVGERVVWLREGRLHARPVASASDAHADTSIELPGGAKDLRFLSCRARNGDVLAVEMKHAVHVLLLRDGGIDRWGETTMAHPELPARAGALGLTCDDAGARLAWAVSEPAGDAHIDMAGRVTLPDGPGHHRIHVAACTPAGCTHREASVSGVDAGWMSIGGWSSPVYMQAPDVADLGARVLLVWKNGDAIRYRLAPLAELDGAPSPWIAETSRPGEHDAQDPRTIAWPRWQIHARGDTALVLVQEWATQSASFLLRFDARGDVQVLTPPAR